MKRPTKKSAKTRQVRAAASPKKKRAKPAVQSIELGLPAPIHGDGFTLYPLGNLSGPLAGLGSLIQSLVGPMLERSGGGRAKTIKTTKFDEHYAIETRDYSCDCGKPDCERPVLYVTAATHNGYPIPSTGMTKAKTMEEVEAQHITGIRAIRDGLATSRLEVHKDLAHALGNCECHGKESPKA